VKSSKLKEDDAVLFLLFYSNKMFLLVHITIILYLKDWLCGLKYL